MCENESPGLKTLGMGTFDNRSSGEKDVFNNPESETESKENMQVFNETPAWNSKQTKGGIRWSVKKSYNGIEVP